MLLAKRFALLMLLIAVGIATAYGQDPLGELELQKGMVKIRRGDRDLYFRKAFERTPIFAGDELHSGGNTRANLSFRDGRDTIRLYSRSLFKIEEVSQRRSFFGMTIGKAFFRVLSKFRKNKFTVQTPTATIGIKGTEFVAATDGVKTFVLTTDGVVGLANVEFPDREVLIRANEASSVSPEEIPAPPIQVPEEDQAGIIEDEGTDTFEELPFEPMPKEGSNEEKTAKDEEEEEVIETPVIAIIEESTETVLPSADPGATTAPVNINVSR